MELGGFFGEDASLKKALFLCTGNSCRSQMAEALLRHHAPGGWQTHSAGSRPTGAVHPLALRVLEELGINASGARSKSVEGLKGEAFDLVVTVCDDARDSCPVFPEARRTEHWPFEDPADAGGTDAEVLAVFRRTRDQIQERILGFLAKEPAAAAPATPHLLFQALCTL